MKNFISVFLFLLLSLNSNSQWVEQSSGVNKFLKSVSAVDNNNVWVCGLQTKVLRTMNGGQNWILTASNGLPLYNDYVTIFGINANTALVAGYISEAHFYTYRTSDGGMNWVEVYHVMDDFINAIWMVNQNEGIMVGDPNIYSGTHFLVEYTTNGGINWYDSYAPPGANYSDVGFVNSLYVIGNNVWFGASSSVKYSANYGNNWTSQYTGMDSYAMFFQNSSTGMAGGLAAGSQGIKYTTDGGLNWTNPTVPGTGSIRGIAGNGSTWWCAKYGRNIYKTTNNGLNWVVEYTSQLGTQQHMSKARNGNRMWVVKDSGGIAMSEGLIGISPVSGEIPNTFSLSQNYPNPFNPTTKIKFQIPLSRGVSEGRSVLVRLIIYDVLGREIASLVDEQLNPGSYEVEWDGSNFPSGVYFYRLKAGDPSTGSGLGYADTKKMIIIK